MDDVYGTNWSKGQPERMWKHGKNTGWPYVVWKGSVKIDESKGYIIPERIKLYQNCPNPFNPVTNIHFSIPKSGYVKLTIYDIEGRKILTLFDGFKNAGTYSYIWDALDSDGHRVASSIYFYCLEAGSYINTKKMVLIR